MPRKTATYLFVLQYQAAGDVFGIVAGYELDGDSVYMLESVGKQVNGTFALGAYGGTSTQFLAAAQAAGQSMSAQRNIAH
jgi:hypothetical protein